MSIPFLITGLPRSRTAWMAEFMTTGNSICAHEPVADIARLRYFYDLFPSRKFVGVSDLGMGLHLNYCLNTLKIPTVIIQRDMDEVEASLMAMGTGLPATNFCDVLLACLLQFKDHPLVKWVPFTMLNDLPTMQKVFWHLTPGEAFDEGRFLVMRDRVIEVDAPEVMRYVKDTGPHLTQGYKFKLKEPSCQQHG